MLEILCHFVNFRPCKLNDKKVAKLRGIAKKWRFTPKKFKQKREFVILNTLCVILACFCLTDLFSFVILTFG